MIKAIRAAVVLDEEVELPVVVVVEPKTAAARWSKLTSCDVADVLKRAIAAAPEE